MQFMSLSLSIAFLIFAGCDIHSASEGKKLTPFQKTQALKEAESLVNDRNMTVPSWYRSRLNPSFKIYIEKEARFWLRSIRLERAKATIKLTPLWKLLEFCAVIYLISPVVLALFPSQDEDETGDIVVFLAVNIAVFVLAFILILPIKLVSQFFLEEGHYIPWHFIVYIINLLYVIFPLISLLIPKDFLESLFRLARRRRKLQPERP